LLKLQFRGLKS